jgi:hypothetical protein
MKKSIHHITSELEKSDSILELKVLFVVRIE